MNSCIVTGGAGLIGSNIALKCQERGWDTIVVDNFLTGTRENLKDFKGKVIDCDISKDYWFKENPKADYVFHLASITDTTIERPQNENIVGFNSILQYIKVSGAKLIWASSAGVYGNGPCPNRLDQERNLLNSYARSKSIMEDLVRDIKGVAIGIRYFNVYGPFESHKKKSASMIFQLFSQMKEGKNPRIFKWGEQKRDFIYVEDAVEITLRACSLEKTTILNAGTGKAISFNNVIGILNQVMGKDLKPEYFDNPYVHFYQNCTEAEMTETQKIINYLPQYSLEQGIKDYISKLL